MNRRHLFTLHLSVQGWGLGLIGFVWAVIGIGIATGVSSPESGQGLWHLIIPADVRAVMWLATAALALLAARFDRLAPLALSVAVVPPLIRFTSYGGAWLTHLWPGGAAGHPTGWYSAAFHLSMIGLVALVAAIRSTPPPDADLVRRITTHHQEHPHA